MLLRILIWYFASLISFSSLSQDAYLSPLKKIETNEKEITYISFSSDSKWIAVSGSKGETSIKSLSDNETSGSLTTPGGIIFHDFIDENKKFILLDNTGKLIPGLSAADRTDPRVWPRRR